MTNIVVDKSTDNAKPHLILFITIISTSKKMFISERDKLMQAVLSRLKIIKTLSKCSLIRTNLMQTKFRYPNILVKYIYFY